MIGSTPGGLTRLDPTCCAAICHLQCANAMCGIGLGEVSGCQPEVSMLHDFWKLFI